MTSPDKEIVCGTASRQPASPMVVASALVAGGSCVREGSLVTAGDVMCPAARQASGSWALSRG